MLRIVLAGFLFGNLFSILYSLAGGMFSFLVMYLFETDRKARCAAGQRRGRNVTQHWSDCRGGVCGGEYQHFYYLPVLFVAGIVTGLLIGVAAQEIILRIGGRLKR